MRPDMACRDCHGRCVQRLPLRPDEAKDWTCCRALAAEIGIVSLPVSPFFGRKLEMDEHTLAHWHVEKRLQTGVKEN